MSSKWSWIFGFLTAGGFILSIVFFTSTQKITARDMLACGIGAILGLLLAGFIATFVFHSNTRKVKLDAVRQEKLAHINAVEKEKQSSRN